MLRAAWERALVRCDFPPVLRIQLARMHLFRHLYACLVLEACDDVKTVADIMAIHPNMVQQIYATIPRDRFRHVVADAERLMAERPQIAALTETLEFAQLLVALDSLRDAAKTRNPILAGLSQRKIEHLVADVRKECGLHIPKAFEAWSHELSVEVAGLVAEAHANLPYLDDEDEATDALELVSL